MNRVKKPVFFIVLAIILVLTITATLGIRGQNGDNTETYIKGLQDIRWGVDIQGGVEATFRPAGGFDATEEQIAAAEAIIETRLVSNNITDYELYVDNNQDRLIVRFPWQSGESNYDPEKAIEEISATALLTFREGMSYEKEELDANGEIAYKVPTGVTAENIILEGDDIILAEVMMTENTSTGNYDYVIALTLNSAKGEDGKSAVEKFAEATKELKGEIISIWMDDLMISYPTVNDVISNGEATITGSFTAQEAKALADKINAGALPFALETESFGSINPTLGMASLDAMAIAGIIAFILIMIFMIVIFRVPGFVAVISLLGQTALSFAAISGYFPFFNSFTLTLPGIAGIILSIGMGVDCNIITATRIKEELRIGKTLDTAIKSGCQHSLSSIVDGNVTVIIVAIILMLVFGPKNILSAIFGPSTTGAIYSFGYTLLVGVIGNFIMGVLANRLMLKSLSGFKGLRKKWLFGGAKEK